jgi:hypothetical protein
MAGKKEKRRKKERKEKGLCSRTLMKPCAVRRKNVTDT